LSPGVIDKVTDVPVFEATTIVGAEGVSAGITSLAKGFPETTAGVTRIGNAELPTKAD
jgi:hypothetical protein